MSNKKISLDKRFVYYKHIDNGGPTISVEDRGLDQGIFLTIGANYHGHPCVASEMQIDSFDFGEKGAADFLRNAGLMLIKAADAIAELDFNARYAAVK